MYRKVAIPCRPQKTFSLLALEIPSDLPEDDIRASLFRYSCIVRSDDSLKFSLILAIFRWKSHEFQINWNSLELLIRYELRWLLWRNIIISCNRGWIFMGPLIFLPNHWKRMTFAAVQNRYCRFSIPLDLIVCHLPQAAHLSRDRLKYVKNFKLKKHNFN